MTVGRIARTVPLVLLKDMALRAHRQRSLHGEVRDWLKLDRAVSSHVRLHGWEKECRTPFAAAPGAHDAVEIALVCSGTVKYTVSGREILVPEGHVIIVPRGVEHATSFLTPVRALALWLGADFVAGDRRRHGPRYVSSFALAAGRVEGKTKRVSTLLEILLDEVNGGASRLDARRRGARREHRHRGAPQGAARRGTSRGARDARVVAAIAQMSASFAEPLGIDDFAKTARMSRFHFSRLFRDEMGQAPVPVPPARAAGVRAASSCAADITR